MILHLVDEIIDGGDELLCVVGVAPRGGILDVLAHHLPLLQHLAIGAAQGGGGDPALGLLQLGGVQGLLELIEPAQHLLALFNLVGHPVGLHPQGAGEVDRLGIGHRIEQGHHGHHGDQARHEQDEHHGAPDGAADRMYFEPLSHAGSLPSLQTITPQSSMGVYSNLC